MQFSKSVHFYVFVFTEQAYCGNGRSARKQRPQSKRLWALRLSIAFYTVSSVITLHSFKSISVRLVFSRGITVKFSNFTFSAYRPYSP